MPEIIVTTLGAESSDESVMLRERVNISDFESAHFAAQLVERLGWAVGDAHVAEQTVAGAEPASKR
jgi:hypothetical protein